MTALGLLPRRLVCAMIRRYQAKGGGLHYFGVACNFDQTCSEYTKQAIQHQGVVQGGRIGWARIKRCKHKGLVTKLDDPYCPQHPSEADYV